MQRPAEARAWWEEVQDTRARIEERRAHERDWKPTRGVRELRPGRRLELVRDEHTIVSLGSARVEQQEAARARGTAVALRRPRMTPVERLGPRPDRIAAWAVGLGLLMVLVAIFTGHG